MLDAAVDQAHGLRGMLAPRPVRVIAVTSGKGGVGKTNVATNLGVALAQRGRDVMLLDADLGLANVDGLLGLTPLWTLAHVLSGERELAEVVIEGPAGLRIVPAASGVAGMADQPAAVYGGLIRAFGELATDLDVLLVDTAAGVGEGVLSFARAAQEVLLVVCDEPASLANAYALIKLLSTQHGVSRFRILANMVRRARDGRALFGKLLAVCDQHLDVVLEFVGVLPHDDYLRKAIQRRQTVMEAFPRSPVASAFRQLAEQVENWPRACGASGHLEFFFERIVQPLSVAVGGEA
ncbi:MAG: MinD/ParA family protein [Immundisolibacter sp.]|uniref:MinD/ParA family protein n=1 Tax=Immundisolibacter sp. TaxID=1934948 RepID=UPI003EE37340